MKPAVVIEPVEKDEARDIKRDPAPSSNSVRPTASPDINTNQPVAVPIKQEEMDPDSECDGDTSSANTITAKGTDTDDLLPQPGEVWGYPPGCPVAYNFQPALRGRGDMDYQVGVIRSVLMDPITRKLIFRVEHQGRMDKNVKLVQIVREDNIGYSTGCPVSITLVGQSHADGEIVLVTPNFDRNGAVESISYTVMLLLDENKRRIISDIPPKQIKYRTVEGEGDSSISNKVGGESEADSNGESSQEAGSRPKTSCSHGAKSKTRGVEGLSDNTNARKHSAANLLRRKRTAPKPATPSSDGASASKERRNTDSVPDASNAPTDSISNGYSELRVGSRVNVLFSGSEWQATILGDNVKNGELGLMVHYKGSKAKSRDWVNVDKIVSLVPEQGQCQSEEK
ncbi:hypothetical protein ACHAWF_017224 [Thalassiosira exigua]